jgi:hypothetical protein
MPFMSNGKRDYKKERAWEKANGDTRGKDRSSRNAARKKAGLKVGDPRHVDHKDSNPRNNSKSNLKPVSAKANLKKEAKAKQRKAK